MTDITLARQDKSLASTPGSLGELAATTGKALAESFMSCDAIIIVDTSGSMHTHDSRGNKSRFEVACEELASVQANLPGKVAIISFNDKTQFCPYGILEPPMGGTDMTNALQFAKVADDITGMHFVLVSDGEPDNDNSALEVARTYKNHIDTIYVGPEREGRGRSFLEKLASVTGGKSVTADRVMLLAEKITLLLGRGA